MTTLLLFLLYGLLLTAALGRAGHRAPPGTGPAARKASLAGAPGRPVARLLIVGASGGTGRQLVAQALERGLTVTALVRRRDRLQVSHPRLTLVEGDVLDERAVEEAMRGQDAVASALGHRRWFGPARILSRGTRHLLAAMERHGVRRLVCLTSLGLGDTAGRLGLQYTFFILPVLLPFYFWDKARQERLVAASGVEWVLVRPGVLGGGARRGQVRAGPGAGSLLWAPPISRADVASFVLDQLTSDAWLRAAPGISR